MSVQLAEVTEGWSDGLSVTYGTCTIEVRPASRTSAAEMWTRLGRRCQAMLGRAAGNDWRAYANDAGRLVIEGPGTFTLTVGATDAARYGFTAGAHTGAANYTAGAVYEGAVGVGDEWGVDAPLGVTSRGLGVVSGSGALSGVERGGDAALRSWEPTATQLEHLAVIGATYDVWADGRVHGRVRADGASISRWGELAANTVLALTGEGVR